MYLVPAASEFKTASDFVVHQALKRHVRGGGDEEKVIIEDLRELIGEKVCFCLHPFIEGFLLPRPIYGCTFSSNRGMASARGSVSLYGCAFFSPQQVENASAKGG